MKAIKLVAFVSVIGFTMAAKHSLKQKLAERGNVLAQAQSNVQAESLNGGVCGCVCPVLDTSCPGDLDAPDCNCTAGTVGEGLPPLGGGTPVPVEVKTVLASNSEQVFMQTPTS